MADLRGVLELELQRVDVAPFTLETFQVRRDRRRRRQRLAAGAVGLAVVIATAISIVLAFERSSNQGIGIGPTPSTEPSTRTARFESRFYGYSLSYPQAWAVRRPDAPWTSIRAGLNSGIADAFIHDGTTMLEIGSIRIPEGMSTRTWLDREERRHLRHSAPSTCKGEEHEVFPTIVDGRPGRFIDCELVLVVAGGRGYVIRLYADIAVQLELREVVRSIELHPKEA